MAHDRLRAAQERAEAAHDRKQASSERVQAAKDREASETDELTHVRRRGAGLAQLQREIDRARRAPEELVVTFSDVDGLKKVNDTMGHLAGDRLLIAVADSLRAGLRSYDLIMRFGGDEFVCALPNMNIRDAHRRFADISKALAEGPTGGSISVGFATLGESDSAETLIHRADEDLLAHRAGNKAQVFAAAFRAEADAIERDPGAPDEGATILREVAEAVKAIPAWVEDDDLRGWARATAESVRARGASISSPLQRRTSDGDQAAP